MASESHSQDAYNALFAELADTFCGDGWETRQEPCREGDQTRTRTSEGEQKIHYVLAGQYLSTRRLVALRTGLLGSSFEKNLGGEQMEKGRGEEKETSFVTGVTAARVRTSPHRRPRTATADAAHA